MSDEEGLSRPVRPLVVSMADSFPDVSKKLLPPSKPADDYESSGADSGDDYVQEKRQSSVVGKARKIKRKRALDADGQPRKRKKRIFVEPDLSELTPEQGDCILTNYML